MHWNYRIVKHANGTLGLHEVHYNESDLPISRTNDAILVGDSIREIEEQLKLCMLCLSKSIIDDNEIKMKYDPLSDDVCDWPDDDNTDNTALRKEFD